MISKPEPSLASIRNLLREVPAGAELTFKLDAEDRVEVKLRVNRKTVARAFQPTRLVHPTRKLLQGMLVKAS